MITNGECKEIFIKYDLKELRQIDTSAQIPPPGWVNCNMPEAIQLAAPNMLCGWPLNDGTTCEKHSRTERARCLQRHCWGQHAGHRLLSETHGGVSPYRFILTNQCPWCPKISSKSITAANHSVSHSRTRSVHQCLSCQSWVLSWLNWAPMCVLVAKCFIPLQVATDM